MKLATEVNVPLGGTFTFNAAVNNTALLYNEDTGVTNEFTAEDILFMIIQKPFVSITDGSN